MNRNANATQPEVFIYGNRDRSKDTLEEYLEHLTENNWHTLRQLIELELGTIRPREREEKAYRAYIAAIQLTTN